MAFPEERLADARSEIIAAIAGRTEAGQRSQGQQHWQSVERQVAELLSDKQKQQFRVLTGYTFQTRSRIADSGPSKN